MPSAPGRILTTHVGRLVRPRRIARPSGSQARRKAGRRARSSPTVPRGRSQPWSAIRRKSASTSSMTASSARNSRAGCATLERLAGFERAPQREARDVFARATYGKDRRDFADFYAEYDPTQRMGGISNWAVTGPISYKGQDALAADLARFKAALQGVDVADAFYPAVAPSSVAIDRKDEYYKKRRRLCRRAGRGAAPRIQGDRRRRFHSANRRRLHRHLL